MVRRDGAAVGAAAKGAAQRERSEPAAGWTRSLDQRRAADALACVQEVMARVTAISVPYTARTWSGLPPAIVMNGLGQALATELAAAGPGDNKGRREPEEAAHFCSFENLNRWLCRPDGGVYPGASDVLTAMMAAPQQAYLRAQAEALAWLEWHKKFCQAHLPRREECNMNARREIRQHGGRREGREKTRRETRKEPLLPLYRFEGALPKECGDGNLGLWFDKFFDRWRLLEPSAQQEERQQGRQQQQERLRRSEGAEAASGIPSWTTQATRG